MTIIEEPVDIVLTQED